VTPSANRSAASEGNAQQCARINESAPRALESAAARSAELAPTVPQKKTPRSGGTTLRTGEEGEGEAGGRERIPQKGHKRHQKRGHRVRQFRHAAQTDWAQIRLSGRQTGFARRFPVETS